MTSSITAALRIWSTTAAGITDGRYFRNANGPPLRTAGSALSGLAKTCRAGL
jgi:hypothetical protein